MTDWIETSDGWVHAARVAAIKPHPEGGAVLQGADDSYLGMALDPDFMPSVIVPAAPGTALLYLGRPEKPGAPIALDRVPVLAWRVPLPLGDGPPKAVTLDGHHEIRDDGVCGAFKAVQLPSGELFAVVPVVALPHSVTRHLPTLADAERLARETWAEADRAWAKRVRAEKAMGLYDPLDEDRPF
jgi:hypothetical protein